MSGLGDMSEMFLCSLDIPDPKDIIIVTPFWLRFVALGWGYTYRRARATSTVRFEEGRQKGEMGKGGCQVHGRRWENYIAWRGRVTKWRETDDT